MQAYIDQIGDFIQSSQVWAGPIVGLLTLGESLLIVGILIPATALLLLSGGLIGTGILDPIPILLWGISGAILGDAISYWLGRWIGPSILRWGMLKRHRTTVARARLFFYRYGFLAVFLGRFLGPIRSTIPTVAGVMGMSHGPFQLANFFSAILWLPLLLLPGYLAAKSVWVAQQSNEMTLFVAGGLPVALGVGLIYIFTRKRSSASNRPEKRRNKRTVD